MLHCVEGLMRLFTKPRYNHQHSRIASASNFFPHHLPKESGSSSLFPNNLEHHMHFMPLLSARKTKQIAASSISLPNPLGRNAILTLKTQRRLHHVRQNKT